MFQQVLIPLAQNIGILALLAVGIASVRPANALSGLPKTMKPLLIGCAFGVATIVVMATPVELRPGLIFDTRAGPVLMSGLLGGPIAAVATGTIAALMRYEIGGLGQYVGAVGILIQAGLGIVAWTYVTRRGRRMSIVELAIFATAATLISLPSIFLLPDFDLAVSLLGTVTPILLISNVSAVVLLGLLVEQDARRDELETDLRRSEAEARQAADAKSRFLAAMSHEVRTPLNGVVGYTELLSDTGLNNFQHRCTEQIAAAAANLMSIIDDIVNYAGIDSSGVAVEVSDTNPRELLAECVESLRPRAESKRLDLDLDLVKSLPSGVLLDPVRLRQAVINILGNAVKFTDRGHVAMKVSWELTDEVDAADEEDKGVLVIEISDTGLGISQEEQARLFQPFAQGAHTGRGGTGLGLGVSRSLIEAMGGSIQLESAFGTGTRVTLRVPATITRTATMPPQAPVPAPEVTSRLRILVVEDVAMNAAMLEAMLLREGHAVTIAENGALAVDAIQADTFDLVLMDVQMPVMNGLDATRAIRALQTSANAIPILALTAYASREDLRRCLDAGMNDFLTKPLDRPKLFEAINRWCSVGNGAVGGLGASDPIPRPTADIVVFDRTRIQELNEVLPAGRTEEFVNESVESVRALLSSLAAIEAVDRRQVENLTHQLTTTAGTIGLNVLRDRARQVMRAAPAAETAKLAGLIADLTETGRRSIQTIETERALPD